MSCRSARASGTVSYSTLLARRYSARPQGPSALPSVLEVRLSRCSESANTHLTLGPIELPSLAPMRIALSVPIVNAHTHPAVAGPVFASHPLDLQTFPVNDSEEKASGPAADAFAFTYLAAVGPPSVNIEAKLLGVDDAAIEAGGDPVGALHIRGPSVGKPAHRVDVREEDQETEGIRGSVRLTR